MMTELATIESTWRWHLMEDPRGAGSYGGYRAALYSDRHADGTHMVEELDLTWCEPADIRRLAEKLMQVADRVDRDNNSDDD